MLSKHNNTRHFFIYKTKLKLISRLLLAALSYHLLFSPVAASALEEIKADTTTDQATIEQTDGQKLTNNTESAEKLIIIDLGVKNISAYNVGDPGQCDASPCTAANGENICLALELGYKRCAANFVPFGTLLEIEGYGRCLVTDRMNARFGNHVDIAMKKTEKPEALKFGRQKLNIKIIKKIEQI